MVEPTPLQRELLQRRPFRSPGHEATVGLLRTAEVVRRQLTAVVWAHGVTLQQYNVLRILRGAGRHGLPTLEIANRMIEQAPGITRLLDRIEARGWVRRRRSTDDRRQVRCAVTTAGLKLLAALDQPVAAADEAAVGALSRQEQRALVRLLDAVRSGPGGRDGGERKPKQR